MYKRKFARVEILTKAPQLLPIDYYGCQSPDETIVQRKGSSSRALRLTLEQFWGIKPSKKLVNGFLVKSTIVDEIPFHMQVKTNGVATMGTSWKKLSINGKIVEKVVVGNPSSYKVHVIGQK